MTEIDAESAEVIAEALAARADLPIDLALLEYRHNAPYPHLNIIVADGRQGYLGTMFLWRNQMSVVQPTGSSFELGLVLDGECLQGLRTQLTGLLPDSRWKPV